MCVGGKERQREKRLASPTRFSNQQRSSRTSGRSSDWTALAEKWIWLAETEEATRAAIATEKDFMVKELFVCCFFFCKEKPLVLLR